MLSAQQRSEINRRNAANSTGPKTEEGKARSRQNALKHGCRSEVLALEHENKDEIQSRTQEWFAYYDPQSPAAKHLTACCVRATLLAERVDRYEHAIVSQQLRRLESEAYAAQEDTLDDLYALRLDDPLASVTKLRRSAAGCRRVLEQWGTLRDRLERHGFWAGEDVLEAIRLMGVSPDEETLRTNEAAYLVRFHATLCCTPPEAANRLFAPDVLPPTLRDFARRPLPDPAACRRYLLAVVDDEMQATAELERHLREIVEIPDAAEAPDRSSLPADPHAARLALRYRAEARTSFHKAFTELRRTLKEDAARAAEEAAEPVSPNEPKSPAETSDAEPRSTNASTNSSRPVEAAPPILVFQPQVTSRIAEIDDPEGRGIRSVGPPAF